MDNITRRIVSIVTALMTALGACDLFAQNIDGIAAVVNDRIVTYSQVKKLVGPTEKQFQDLYQGVELYEKIKEARLNALRSLIERELIIQDFKGKGFFLPDNLIEDRYQEVIRKQYDGDRTALVRTLQANGASVSRFKEDLREQMIVQIMRSQNVRSAVIVSPYKIEQYYQDNAVEFLQPDQVKLSLIFLRKGLFKEKRKDSITGEERDVDPQKLIAEELLQKIQTGSDFGNLAKTYSEASNRRQGGSMGWVSEKTLRKELTKIAFALRPGQNSGIVDTEEGYYILLVEDKRKAIVIPLEEVREQIEVTLEQRERERLQEEWLDSLKAKAFIKKFD
ncbi:MAG: peptidylprolyl isomerase [Verrucomicrobiota bacterium]